MNILVIWDGMNGVAYHRLYIPHHNLATQLLNESIISGEPIAADVSICQRFSEDGIPALEQFDLVVFNRWIGPIHQDFLKELARKKVPYIVDIDDFWKLPKFHPAYNAYREKNITQEVKESIRYANGVTCTTEQLAAEIRQLNPRVKILPNALDLTDPQWNQPAVQSDKLRFGYVSGVTHANDVGIMGEAIGKICEEFDVEFHLYGIDRGNVHWEDILYKFNGYSDKLRPQIKLFAPKLANEYGKYYANFDVALAPLADNKFNNLKSELKILEAAAYSLPVICSDISPYTNHMGNAGVWRVRNSAEHWYNAIKEMIGTNPKLRKSLGQMNREYCTMNHNIEEVNAARFEFYKQCCSVTKGHQ